MYDYKVMEKIKIIEDEKDGEIFLKNVINKLKEIEMEKEKPNITFLNNIERLILEDKIVLGTPVLNNILRDQEPVSSCTVVPIDLKNDLDNLETILKPYSRNTIGSGYDLNKVDNPCEVIEKINNVIHTLIQKSNSNRLSAMGTLSIESPEILNFIKLKNKRDFNTCHYNISVMIPDDFFEQEKEYEIIKDGKNIKMTNKEILNEVANSIHYCGEPGIVFSDRFDETNPLKQDKYKYKSVAPCAEIAMSEGEMCQFSYINLSKMIDENENINKDELKLAVQITTRMLDNLCDISINNSNTSSIIEDKRRIGIGVCGFADMLAKLEMEYGSVDSLKLAENIFSYINFYSKVESVKLARDRGAFRKFKESECSNTSWYDRFIKKDNWISEIEWETLKDGIKKYGIRNSSTTAVPPTGRAAQLVNSSYSIEPYFSLIDSKFNINPLLLNFISKYPKDEQDEIIRNIFEKGTCQNLNDKYNKLKEIFRIATEIEPKKHLEMVKVINECIDDSVSKTINLSNNTSSKQIYEYILDAYNKRLNGITFFRDKCLDERDIERN